MKAYTDPEQSKQLAKILPLESADMENKVSLWKRIIEKILFHLFFVGLDSVGVS